MKTPRASSRLLAINYKIPPCLIWIKSNKPEIIPQSHCKVWVLFLLFYHEGEYKVPLYLVTIHSVLWHISNISGSICLPHWDTNTNIFVTILVEIGIHWLHSDMPFRMTKVLSGYRRSTFLVSELLWWHKSVNSSLKWERMWWERQPNLNSCLSWGRNYDIYLIL